MLSDLADNQTGHSVTFEFQINKKYFIVLVYPKHCMGHTYTKTLFTVHLKFHFNWPFCILSSNPTDKVNLYFVCQKVL